MWWTLQPVTQVHYASACSPRIESALKTSLLVPFDEDEREPSVWFLDHNYLENMTAMFRKVNGSFVNNTNYFLYTLFSLFSLCIYAAREHIVGWYHTGPKLHPNDIAIHELIGRFCPNPVSRHASTSILCGLPPLFVCVCVRYVQCVQAT